MNHISVKYNNLSIQSCCERWFFFIFCLVYISIAIEYIFQKKKNKLKPKTVGWRIVLRLYDLIKKIKSGLCINIANNVNDETLTDRITQCVNISILTLSRLCVSRAHLYLNLLPNISIDLIFGWFMCAFICDRLLTVCVCALPETVSTSNLQRDVREWVLYVCNIF